MENIKIQTNYLLNLPLTGALNEAEKALAPLLRERSQLSTEGKVTTQSKALRLLSEYLNGSPTALEAADKIPIDCASTAAIISTVFIHAKKLDAALKTISNFKRDVECCGIAIQIYLMMSRVDLAKLELQNIAVYASDEPIYQIYETWIILHSEDSIQQAFYAFEELISTFGPIPKLLNSQAACQIQRGMIAEAESLLLECLKLVFVVLS